MYFLVYLLFGHYIYNCHIFTEAEVVCVCVCVCYNVIMCFCLLSGVVIKLY